jgi:N-acetylglucosaminyldiphosphoundecaprenol N-acetyl-beta-D-mannosaminyltransferase
MRSRTPLAGNWFTRTRYLLTVLEYPPKFRIGSIDFNAASFDKAIRCILTNATGGHDVGTSFHFANAYNIALAENDVKYQEVMNQGDYVFADGTPVVWAGRTMFPNQTWERVYGPDVMASVLGAPDSDSVRHYFLGSTPATMDKLLLKVRRKFPEARLVGYDCPPFRSPTESELRMRDEKITESGATVVWVGLGTPKQDLEIQRLAQNLPVAAMAVGAAFDFLAETVPQAPRWMHKSGLEWSYRLAREPQRLAKRYLWGNPQFLKSVVKHRP